MAYLEVKAVTKSFDNPNGLTSQAIKMADFSINEGELVVFVGPSGCGKSTLLRMIAGLETITSGEIVLQGQVINDLEVSQRQIAMVFQDYALYPHMSVKENLTFGLENQKINSQVIEEKVSQVLDELELNEFASRLPKALSGGQRQRVALARALVKNPKVYLLDEPLSNLDARLRVQTRKLIAQLHERLHATMIYVTHDQIEAMTLGDRIVVMDQGIIQQIASPEEIYTQPANTFVARFMGTPSMNLLSVDLDNPSTACLEEVKELIHQKLEQAGIQEPLKEVIVGIRPEAIQILPASQGLEPELVEYLGAENLVYFKLHEGELIVKVGVSQKIDRSQVYEIKIDPESIYLFDQQNGLRIH